MITISKAVDYNPSTISVDPFWNLGDEPELRIHRIHAYPAKFPAFITSKALQYARRRRIKPLLIADIFCGCGTVAFEAKRNNIPFWGCDINPIATLIAKAKSNNYQTWRLIDYLDKIEREYKDGRHDVRPYQLANDRIRYWFDRKSYNSLVRLRQSINAVVPISSKYHTFFLVAFSNILKPASRWLTKSIKPQIDPKKESINILEAFRRQCQFAILSYEESDVAHQSTIAIKTANILSRTLKKPEVDMIITSPPYVTSYEYADLHQLSALWLDCADDYRDLRAGSIGSHHNDSDFEQDLKRLNVSGSEIVAAIKIIDPSKARAVARYFVDMQRVSVEAFSMLKQKGIALFVIGNTRYSGVRVDNARHLIESLINAGFSEVRIAKRKISKKILTPFRNPKGRFTADGRGRKVYNEEYIIVGNKNKDM